MAAGIINAAEKARFRDTEDKNVILNVFKKNEWKQYLFKKNYIIIFIRITIQYNNHIFF